MLKGIAVQYLLGIGLALLVCSAWYWPFVFDGWGLLNLIYASVLVIQMAFYYITSRLSLGWSVLAFVVNFILWVIELGQLEHMLDGTPLHHFLYHDDDFFATRYILGGVFWVTNKLLIETFLVRNKGVAVSVRVERLTQWIGP